MDPEVARLVPGAAGPVTKRPLAALHAALRHLEARGGGGGAPAAPRRHHLKEAAPKNQTISSISSALLPAPPPLRHSLRPPLPSTTPFLFSLIARSRGSCSSYVIIDHLSEEEEEEWWCSLF